MDIGKVIWFDIKKGYGFIKRQAGSDVFVHYSKILGESGDFKVLNEGDVVEFEVFLADRTNGSRPQAKNVRLIGGKNEILQKE